MGMNLRLVVLLLGACASIQANETVTNTPMTPTVRHERIELALSNGHTRSTRSNDRGEADFSLLAIPEEGLPDTASAVAVVIDVSSAPATARPTLP